MTALTHAAPVLRGGRTTDTALAGTGTLIRFVLRRDRVRIPAWIVALVLTTAASAASFPDLYPTAADRQARAALLHDNPAGVAFSGPGYGLRDYTFGAMLSNELLWFLAIFAALMSVLLVVRHTRTEEETGRAELLRAAVVGRHAHLTAAIAVGSGANLALGLLLALALGGSGVESLTWVGSVAFGAAVAAVGLVFTGVAAVAVQLTEHARASSGLAGAMIGVAFVLRAVGDIGNGVLSWLSPIGWAQATRAYVDERWWPLGLAVAVAAALAAVAYALSTRRDVGAGMVAQRPGPATASSVLGRPVGFALRLQRGGLIAWGVALFAFGAVYGSVVSAVQDFIRENEAARRALASGGGASPLDSFLALIVGMLAMLCAIAAVQAVSRMRAEEAAGRLEPVLGTALSRTGWLASHLTVTLVGTACVLTASGLGLGLGAAVAGGDAELLGRILGATLVRLPALWFTVGVAVALFGLVPRLVALAWVVPVYALVVGLLGGFLRFPDWMSDLSPFGRVPQLPGAELTATPLVVLTVLAAALVTVGVAAFRARDVRTG
ncbi:MAG: ABC transporter permease [Streptosporangiaceae bacterium]